VILDDGENKERVHLTRSVFRLQMLHWPCNSPLELYNRSKSLP
jgi:hypothetical protein